MRAAAGFALAWLVVASMAQDIPSCGRAVRLDVDVGESARGRFAVNGSSCPEGSLLMYRKASGSGNLQVNARGDYLYAAPQQEMGETFTVAATCGSDPLCQLSVGVSVARPLTMPPSSTAPAGGNSMECARQFFTVALGSSVSDSLATSRNAPPCAGTRSYATSRMPTRGTVVLASNGDFRFDAPASLPWWKIRDETWAEFRVWFGSVWPIAATWSCR